MYIWSVVIVARSRLSPKQRRIFLFFFPWRGRWEIWFPCFAENSWGEARARGGGAAWWYRRCLRKKKKRLQVDWSFHLWRCSCESRSFAGLRVNECLPTVVTWGRSVCPCLPVYLSICPSVRGKWTQASKPSTRHSTEKNKIKKNKKTNHLMLCAMLSIHLEYFRDSQFRNYTLFCKIEIYYLWDLVEKFNYHYLF